jgi:hypothetical protein
VLTKNKNKKKFHLGSTVDFRALIKLFLNLFLL